MIEKVTESEIKQKYQSIDSSYINLKETYVARIRSYRDSTKVSTGTVLGTTVRGYDPCGLLASRSSYVTEKGNTIVREDG